MTGSGRETRVFRLLASHGFEAFFSKHPDPIFIYDLDGIFVEANQAFYRVSGVTRELMLTLSPEELGLAESTVMEEKFQAAATGEPQHLITKGVRSNGESFASEITLVPFEVDGEVIAVVGTSRDLQEIETARSAAEQLEERLTTTLDSISDAVYVLDSEWRFTYLNRRAEALVGQASAELLGHSMWEMFPGMHTSPLGPAYRKAVEERTTEVVRTYFESLDLWVEARAYPTKDGLAVYARDIRDEEINRIQLLESQKRLAAQAALLDVATDAIIVRDLGHHVQYWNLSATRMYGWKRSEVIGAYLPDLLYRDPTEFTEAARHTAETGFWSGELEQVTRDGSRIVVQATWTLVRNEAGDPESIFTVSTDITDQKRQEQLLLRTQRVESLGTLASGIAHDLNNVLTPILMSAQLLAYDEQDPGKREIIAAIETGVKRGADMVRQVLSFARGVEGRRLPVQLGALVDELLTFGREALPPDIQLSSEIEPELWSVEGDPTQLLQVLMNLVTNARDAMPGGGHLSISARNVTLSDAYSSVTHLATPGDYVHIQVEDDGIGMPKDVVEKIFEPFFTTKAHGHGTGLGLAVSIAIIRSHGGFMQVYSEPGHGSRFQIHLPAFTGSDLAAATSLHAEEQQLHRGNGQLVLVVDDEDSIRQITRQSLEAHGYRTLGAANGAEALDLIEANPEPVELVFTDMMMPVMDGAALAAHLATSHPDLPIIATSGLNANGGLARSRNAGVRRFLSKPYTTGELLAGVQDALRGGPA